MHTTCTLICTSIIAQNRPGPLLIAKLIDAVGLARRVLVALSPTLICLAFAGLTWSYGMLYLAEMGRSRQGVWLLAGLSVALAGMVGWALFMHA